MVAFSDLTQVMQNARTDAKTLDEYVHGAADTQVTSRLNKRYWTLATLDNKLSIVKTKAEKTLADIDTLAKSATDSIAAKSSSANATIDNKAAQANSDIDSKVAAIDTRADTEITNLQSAINTAAAAGAGENGWAALLVQDASGQTQQQINDKTKKATEFYVTPQMFAPKSVDIGDGVVDASNYIIAALNSGHPVKLPVPSVKYRMTKNLVLNGNVLSGECASPELHGSSTSKVIIEFDGVSGDAVKNINTLSTIKNIWFRQKSWTTELNGLYLERYAYVDNCLFTNFNGLGFYANASDTNNTINPFHTVFNRSQFLYNAKHGIAIYNGANAITLRDCLSRWNGATVYGQAPNAGQYDGLYVAGYNPSYPPSTTLMEPQGLLVIGGDYSYNSRHGQNWHKAFDSLVLGGYVEGNKVSDLRVGASFSTVISNMMTQQPPVLECVLFDSQHSEINQYSYPNNIIVRGYNYGTGVKDSNNNYIKPSNNTRFVGSNGVTDICADSKGGVSVNSDSAQDFIFSDKSFMTAHKWRLGGYIPNTNTDNYISAATATEGERYCFFATNGQFGELKVANGGGANSADAFLIAPKNSATGRSINAGGTVNTAGADYAEYMLKSADCTDIKKGEIVGVNKDGQLTKRYDDAISFVVKSTNPSFVGGDIWFTDVLSDDATDEQKAEFNKQLENARKNVDRVAFCGQVPIVYKANVGDYIIPTSSSDGTIIVETTKSPTFEQHLKCVGKVWKVIDGIAHIVIFNN